MKRVFGEIAIYWINLDKSIDRKINMERELQNTNNKRITAIDGTHQESFSCYSIVGTPNNLWTTPLISCACSHLKAIRTAYDDKLTHVIILEDKCHFTYIDYIQKTIDEMIQETTIKYPDWEIIQLHCVPIPDQRFKSYQINGLIAEKRTSERAYGLNYLINKSGMEKIISKFKPTNNSFYFSPDCDYINPEELIYSSCNTYILNFPLLYVYSPVSTFDFYLLPQEKANYKKNTIMLQLVTHEKIKNFILKNPVTSTKNSRPIPATQNIVKHYVPPFIRNKKS